MTEALQIATIFLGMSSLVAVPLAVLIGLPAAAYVARAWLRLKERELDLRRLEIAATIRQSRLLPAYVDPEDPDAILAWARTDGEMATLELRR